MKRKLFVIIFALVMAASYACLCACSSSCGAKPSYQLSLVSNEEYFYLTVGDEVDYTQYFIVKDSSGNRIEVSKYMLDLSEVDTSEPGTFSVTLTIGRQSITANFMVVHTDESDTPDELKTVFAKYADISTWNFGVYLTTKYENVTNEYYYEYLGHNILYQTTSWGDTYNYYLGYDESSGKYYYYDDNGDGTYDKYEEGSAKFNDQIMYYSFSRIIDLSQLNNYSFTKANDGYAARNPAKAGNAVLGKYGYEDWESLTVFTYNGMIIKVVGVQEDDFTVECDLVDQGFIGFTLPDGTGSGDTSHTGGTTVKVSIPEYASANNWENLPENTTIIADSNITITGTDGAYYSSSRNWRLYQSKWATLTFTAASKCKILTVTVTYESYKNGILKSTDGTKKYASGTTISVNATSVTFDVGNTGTATNGQVRITAIEVVYSGGSTGGGTTSSNTMNKQTYNPSTFNKENLQDKMLKVEGAVGLPSTGTYNALVIPVQFQGDTITNTQLSNLNIAFNGTEAQTGWESVKTYYQKASYGKLNLSFDIQSVYKAQHNSSYYSSYSENYMQDGETYTRTGEEVILMEALAYYENLLDLTKYDHNKDGTIDAVYLIYSSSVDYDNADFYWAYVTWYYGNRQFDGLDTYYYLFAGFDFMDESTARDPGSGYDKIDGLKINAATYIHESGHLLGLDDYYDYDTKSGANEGLGGADMMDYTVGDHNVYSKIMLGWLDPKIVNETTTVTIESSQSSGSAILIPLNFNNSYFCEYLLIDLYSAQGLNALHSSVSNSVLYDGAAYGVRIYHVSSSINDPYNNSYGSFTDNNNSMSNIALIKLVEADGERKFSSTNGYAAASDLWRAGDKLSDKFPAYTRNDGKKVNFDISIDSVSATSAKITITFN